MIRERVSTKGVLRPLEDEAKLDGCTLPLDEIGVFNEKSVRRYLKGQKAWEKKFSGLAKSIDKTRNKNLALAKTRDLQILQRLETRLQKAEAGPSRVKMIEAPPVVITDDDATPSSPTHPLPSNDAESEDLSHIQAHQVLGSRQWSWGWALDGENPPPSSIVARRDTDEARRLGKIADKQLGSEESEHAMSGNNLWQIIMEMLTDSGHGKVVIGPEHTTKTHETEKTHEKEKEKEKEKVVETALVRSRSFVLPPVMEGSGSQRSARAQSHPDTSKNRNSIFSQLFIPTWSNSSPEKEKAPIGDMPTVVISPTDDRTSGEVHRDGVIHAHAVEPTLKRGRRSRWKLSSYFKRSISTH